MARRRPDYLAVEERKCLLITRSAIELSERPTVPPTRRDRGRPETLQAAEGAVKRNPG